MNADRQAWEAAVPLLDTALGVPPDQLEGWLQRIEAGQPGVGPLLRRLLAAHRKVETNDLWQTLARPPLTAPAAEQADVPKRVGPFEILRPLGQGGMGWVWLARYADGVLKRHVALKLPSAHIISPGLRERFARERDFLALLEHPHIARLYEAGVSETGQPYLAMEYVEGVAIDVHCDRAGLPVSARLRLFADVLDAVQFAHRNLVLHRDLKPGNVLVGARGEVKLLDFGIAKLMPVDDTQPGATELTQMAGAALTPAYAAPEQITGAPVTIATDVYALGVMLYRLLTGSQPYKPERETRGALEEAILRQPPILPSAAEITQEQARARATTPSRLRKALRGDLDTIVQKALKKDPAERYATVDAFAQDIERVLGGYRILARPDSAWYRTRKFVQRHPWAVGASAVAMLALGMTTVVAVWQAQVADANAAQARKESTRLLAVQNFMSGLFSNADPEKSHGATMTAREMLDAGRDRIESELAGDPETRALVYARIGLIYSNLGLTEDNLLVQRRRVAALEQAAVSDRTALVEARIDLGQALLFQPAGAGRQEAIALLTSAKSTADDPRVDVIQRIRATYFLADVLRLERRFSEADTLAAEAVQLAEKHLPRPHPTAAAAYEIAAMTARDDGRFDQARSLFTQAILIDQSPNGRGKVDQAGTLSTLAQLEYDVGDFAAALRGALATIEFARQNLGDVRANIAAARRLAVFAAERTGDLQNAERLVAELLEPELASGSAIREGAAQLAAARVDLSAGRLDEAERRLTAAESALQTSVLWWSRVRGYQAELALRRDMPALARTLMQSTLERQVATFGDKSNELVITLEWLGIAQAMLGDPIAGAEKLERACAIRRATRPSMHPARVRCEANLLLFDSGRPASDRAAGLRRLAAQIEPLRHDQSRLLPSLLRVAQVLETAPIRPANASLFLIE